MASKTQFVKLFKKIGYFEMIILLFVAAIAGQSEFEIRCDERCIYEWNARGKEIDKKCKCLVELDLKMPPPLKIQMNTTPPEKKKKSFFDE